MNHVLSDSKPEVPSNATWSGIKRVSRADNRSENCNGSRSFKHDSYYGRGGNVTNQLVIKSLSLMHRIESLCFLWGDLDHFETDDFESFSFKSCYRLTSETSADGIRFDYSESTLNHAMILLEGCYPLHLARFSSQKEHVPFTFTRAESKHHAIIADKHHPRAWSYVAIAEGAFEDPWHLDRLSRSQLPCLALSLSQHQDIAESDGTFDISRENSTFLASLEESNSNLHDLARHSGSSYNLDYFCWGNSLPRDFSH